MSQHHPARRLVFASLIVLLVAGAPALGEIHDVTLTESFEFSPKTVTIAVGDTVRWTNATGMIHDVRADDASFASPAGSNFVFSHTFNAPGTEGYHCVFHGGPGVSMFGTVVVAAGAGGGGGGGGGEPGILRLSAALYTVGEAAGTAVITVQRTAGDDGAVSVGYSAAAGSASAGQDFTAVSGTLSWASGDDAPKTFNVPILNDTAVEGLETIALALSAPSGGATLDAAFDTATLRIQDNDQPTGGTPAAPANLVATASSSSEIALTWQDNATNETGFRVEARLIDGTFEEVATAGANATGVVAAGLDPATLYVFRVQAEGGATDSAFSNEADATTFGLIGPCTPGPTALCVQRLALPGGGEVAGPGREHGPRSGRARSHGARLRALLLLQRLQPRAPREGAQCLRAQPALLGVLRRHDERRARSRRHRHPDGPDPWLLQPAQPAGAAGAGHERARDVLVRLGSGERQPA